MNSISAVHSTLAVPRCGISGANPAKIIKILKRKWLTANYEASIKAQQNANMEQSLVAEHKKTLEFHFARNMLFGWGQKEDY